MYISSIRVYVCEEKLFFVGVTKDKLNYRLLVVYQKDDDDDDKKLILTEEDKWFQMTSLMDNMEKYRENISSPIRMASKMKALIGFIKLYKYYYIMYVDSKKIVGNIGYHSIYTIKNAKILLLESLYTKNYTLNMEEKNYLKLLNSFDLNQNFYYSYTYDLKHTVQYNNSENGKYFNQYFSKLNMDTFCMSKSKNYHHYCKKYVWNYYHTKIMRKANISNYWIVDLIHGFIAQNKLDINGRRFFITLIARRSRKYAGTRYLKRGSNDKGYAANEVETEQILSEDTSIYQLKISSYVQMRGSVPFNWSQTVNQSSITPKPPIVVSIHDPYYVNAGKHFKQLLIQYGSPIICLNLVKVAEKFLREGILSEALEDMTEYLNQFLPDDYHIQYISFDMARIKKRINKFALIDLIKLSKKLVKRTGIYMVGHSQSDLIHLTWNNAIKKLSKIQHGIVRLNCVDCLDRTNVAQFLLGYNALVFQMNAFGLLNENSLKIDSPIVTVLEELYDAHGNTLALQYGGSMTAHRINTYIKFAPWSDVSRDLFQNVSRYLNNAFQDHEKQQVMNLFLGIYRPYDVIGKNSTPLWEMISDYNLHHSNLKNLFKKQSFGKLTNWYPIEIIKLLPFSRKKSMELKNVCDIKNSSLYDHYHQPYKYTLLSSKYTFNSSTISLLYRSDSVVKLNTSRSSINSVTSTNNSSSIHAFRISSNSNKELFNTKNLNHPSYNTKLIDKQDNNDKKIYEKYINYEYINKLFQSFHPKVYKKEFFEKAQAISIYYTHNIPPFRKVIDQDVQKNS